MKNNHRRYTSLAMLGLMVTMLTACTAKGGAEQPKTAETREETLAPETTEAAPEETEEAFQEGDDAGDPDDVPETAEETETANVFTVEEEIPVVNPRGDIMTLYHMSDGCYVDCDDNVFLYDGTEAWYQEGSEVEWNACLEGDYTENGEEHHISAHTHHAE